MSYPPPEASAIVGPELALTADRRHVAVSPAAASWSGALRGLVANDVLPTALPAFVLSRLALLVVGLWSLHGLPMKAGDGDWQDWQPPVPPDWVAIFSRWDTRWLYYVATEGYTYHADKQSDLVFPPLLPALMRFGALLQGQTDKVTLLTAGVVASNLALLGALIGLSYVVRRLWGSPLAGRSVVILALFPTSFFLSVAYSDALFLAFAIGAFAFALDGRWWAVGIVGALAALSRTYGVLLLAPMAYEYLTQRRFRLSWDAAWLALLPIAFLIWLSVIVRVSGDFFVLPHMEQTWTRQVMPPWQTLGVFFSTDVVQSNFKHAPLDLAFTLLAILFAVGSWRLGRPSLAIYATLMLLPMVMTGLLVSNPRYTVLLFPGFIVLAQLLCWRPAFAGYALISAGLGLAMFAHFATGWWVA